MKKQYILLSTALLLFISCNKESIIEGRTAEKAQIIEVNRTVAAGINSYSANGNVPINIDGAEAYLYVNFYYHQLAVDGGTFTSTLMLQSPYGQATILSACTQNSLCALRPVTAGTTIEASLFENTNAGIVNMFKGNYKGILNPANPDWESLYDYTVEYNPGEMKSFGDTLLFPFNMLWDGATYYGWIELIHYANMIEVVRIGYRKFGAIKAGGK